MKTVDALIAARDFFINDPSRWTKGALHKVVNGKNCFCALGAVSLVSGCLNGDGARVPGVAVSCTFGPIGFKEAGPAKFFTDATTINALSRKVLGDLEKYGIHLKAGAGAVKYLSAACHQLFGSTVNIVTVNDGRLWASSGAEQGYGYNGIMKAFDVAITNAKRRHITGDRKKSVKATFA